MERAFVELKAADGMAIKIDITDLPPLTLGDKKVLKKDYGADLSELKNWPVETEAKFMLFLLRKFRAETTQEEVDTMPLKMSQEVVVYVLGKSNEVNIPFSKRSTPSPQGTGGA